MRILVAHNYYQQSGGEDTVVQAEIEMLAARGHHVATFTVHNDAIKDMTPLTVAGKTCWNRKTARELTQAVQRERPDVVHFHNTFPLLSPSVYYAARKQGAAVVQTLHNYRLMCPNGLFFRNGAPCEDCLGKAAPWPGIVHRCYRDSAAASAVVAGMLTTHRAVGTYRRAVDAYIAMSGFARDKFIRGGLPAEKIFVKPNFLARDPGSGAGRGEYAVFIGRLSEEKGVELLLDAWQMLDDLMPLKIIGDGPLAARVAAVAAKHSHVSWLGKQDYEQVCQIVGDAACLVAPSLCYEGSPRAIIESFALGTPVIAPRLGAMLTMVDHRINGASFEPGDRDDLLRQVMWMTKHRDCWPKLRAAAREAYDAHYSAKRNYRLMMKVYEHVAPQSAARIDQTKGAA